MKTATKVGEFMKFVNTRLLVLVLLAQISLAYGNADDPFCTASNTMEEVIETVGTPQDREKQHPNLHEAIHQGSYYNDCFEIVLKLWETKPEMFNDGTYLDKYKWTPRVRLEKNIDSYCSSADEKRIQFIERALNEPCASLLEHSSDDDTGMDY